jgi:hypothetical protein
MHAEALQAFAHAHAPTPGPPRWLAIAAVWVIVAAIDYASRRSNGETSE